MAKGLLFLGLLLGALGCDDGLEGRWIGDTEESLPGIRSSRIELSISQVDEDGTVTGTVRYGEPIEYAPATDPDRGYPEGFTDHIARGDAPLLEGFAYPISGRYDDTRRTLEVDRHLSAPWSEWCQLQTPYPADDRHQCMPNCGVIAEIDGSTCLFDDTCEALPDVQIDCGTLWLCRSFAVCSCDAGGCSAAGVTGTSLRVELADGTLRGSAEDGRAVVLRRE